jgi:hypothetical protein
MTPYAQLPTHKPEEFLRIVGLSQEDFLHLHGKLAAYLDEQKALNPLTRRGRKDSKLALEDRLLLTLYYLRHYPTLINLAAVFGISESYCHKVYARTARLLAKVEKLPNRHCWKIPPPPWPLMFRSSLSSALLKTRKRTTQGKKNATRSKHSS